MVAADHPTAEQEVHVAAEVAGKADHIAVERAEHTVAVAVGKGVGDS